MAFEFKLKHQKANDFQTHSATGVLAQKMSDGMLHLTFHRDRATIEAENFVTTTEPVPGTTQIMELAPAENPVDSEVYREDVATIIIPGASVPLFVELFAKLTDVLGNPSAEKPVR